MIMWLGIIWVACALSSTLWFWYLHKNGTLIGEYPYDGEM